MSSYTKTRIKQLLDTKKIAYYARYVDDIPIIYDETKISPQDINLYAENIHKNIKLNTSYEEKNSIDFLNLSITRTHNKLTIDIYRKPMTTNTTINFMSNHPLEHKMAASRYHIERMHKLP